AGLTYAEYARHGFFELATVTALALPLLLLTHWLFRAESRAHEVIFKALAGTMVGLLFVVVASALQRMHLYTSEFGLTELRLYTTIFMFWISVVLLWFVLTVVRSHRDRFAFGALVAGFAAILAINAMNPDALIAKTNIDRLQEGKRFDPYYLTTLSADAIPTIVDSLPDIGQKHVWQDFTLQREILYTWTKKPKDWRTWNLGRTEAYRVVKAYAEKQNGSEPDTARVNPLQQQKALMHHSGLVIHNMLWIKHTKQGISEASVASTRRPQAAGRSVLIQSP
ncbi:MAG: DUF4173 domain-containing protein, partial [Chloroflexota bacterium]|nr:DUF4173 domain-containing protein [Chloroflexota bacterium]